MWQSLRDRNNPSWWAAALLTAIFVGVFYWLNCRKYLAFQLRAPDVDQFSQAIWNTLNGRFLFTTITNRSILAFHFSPFMAFLSPLLVIWSDARILFLAQTVGIGVTGLILFGLVTVRHRRLAPWLLLAFYMNASLHLIALFELRRVTLAMPAIALALYGLHRDRKGVLLVGIVLALLVKEDIGLFVFMVGVLLLLRRDWVWGSTISVLGLGWTIGMLLWVIPGLRGGEYHQLSYFSEWGDSLSAIVSAMVSDPVRMLERMFDREGLLALWRLFLPLAIVLPFLAPGYTILAIPMLMMMLLSSDPDMHALRRWYLAPVIPVFFVATAVGLERYSHRTARRAVALLLAATAVAYVSYSAAPLGGKYEPSLYKMGDRQRRAWEIVRSVPNDAIVASQAAFVTQLAHREHIYIYPWYAIGEENIEYFVLGRDFNSYPVPAHDIDWAINNLIANPDMVVEMEGDGIYLLHQGGEQQPSFAVNQVAERSIKLDRFEVAVEDDRGFLNTIDEEPLLVDRGQQLRITLYWEALSAPNAERTVSIRLSDYSGALVAQHDMMPAQGSRPTSWWQPGWRFRDVYYLSTAQDALSGPGSLELVLYDSYSKERVPFGEGNKLLELLEVQIND